MDGLFWQMRIRRSWPRPWPLSPGLFSWTPKFEGKYDGEVTCTDNFGGKGLVKFTLFVVNNGSLLNHPPIILCGPTQTMIINAGEEFILHPLLFLVVDPDGDEIYASCNVGTCGHTADGSHMWKFQSNIPGSYMVEIVFYDIRGGYAIMEFTLEVKP